MSVNRLIVQNLKANLRNYYLYVFALTFSVALYFAFVTLQYDPAMDQAKGSIKGAAAMGAASVLLIAIVAVFNLYANNIFVKRRSREIGLLQLIGLTKGGIFRMLAIENAVLYLGSLLAGSLAGFSVSKLLLMTLLAVTEVEAEAKLRFAPQALVRTALVFGAIFAFIMAVNYVFIKRQTILALFRVTSSTEIQVKRLGTAEAVIGALGLVMVAAGYYVSSKLFSGDFMSVPELLGAMLFILGAVILGTYLIYKGSVRLILNFVRKRRNGYLNVREVLSLSSIMFRMKSNALLLTVITTVSALAIGLLSLSYIAYYSTEKTAADSVPHHFAITDAGDAQRFADGLAARDIAFERTEIEVVQVHADLRDVLDADLGGMMTDPSSLAIPAVSEKAVPAIEVAAGETVFTGYNDLMRKFMTLRDSGRVVLRGANETVELDFAGLRRPFLVSWYFRSGDMPMAIVDDAQYRQLKADEDPAIRKLSSRYIGFDVAHPSQLAAANGVYHELALDERSSNASRPDLAGRQKRNMGLAIFIVAFLGLTFLITSGCILYFKQMDQSEEERPTYTILRKLGFTQGDLLGGIRLKQLFNFGIPLVVGLCHGYFAVQSGWFLFGTELWLPMFVVMLLYTALYSVFGVLSVQHYKKVIRGAL